MTVKRFVIRWGMVLMLSAAFLLALALVPRPAPEAESERFPGGVIRFHVIAASDNPQDQELKLKVRDAVLNYLRPELARARDESTAYLVIQERLPEIREVAADTLRAAGCRDRVEVLFGVHDYPARSYGPLTFPAGSYRSLRIVLGDGEGRNWWCCLFPPLCYVDLTRSARSLAEERNWRDRPDQREVFKKTAVVAGRKERAPRLSTKIGEWLDDSRPPLLSWLWKGRT